MDVKYTEQRSLSSLHSFRRFQKLAMYDLRETRLNVLHVQRDVKLSLFQKRQRYLVSYRQLSRMNEVPTEISPSDSLHTLIKNLPTPVSHDATHFASEISQG
jgi:hypothetical protein